MSLTLASGWLAGGADLLGKAGKAAAELGFGQVHASRPPRDAAAALSALQTRGLVLTAVEAEPVVDVARLSGALSDAAKAAAVLRRAQVVVDLGRLEARPREAKEAAVERLSRALFSGLGAHSGLSVALRVGGTPASLLDFRATEWLLDDLEGRPVGLWFDPPRARALEVDAGGPPVLRWADRFASRTHGVAIHGRGNGQGHAQPEESGLDWGSLRDLVPLKAWRVLDVGADVTADEVVDLRRRFEEVLSW